MAIIETKEMWQAVVERDNSFDGSFVYAVKTTGVYCRPSCASRQAKEENVTIFAQSDEAVEAGFRPCKRCRSDELSLKENNLAKVTAICRLIEGSENQPNLETMARLAGLSPYHFHRLFKSFTGVTPKAYAAERQAARIREELHEPQSITEAIFEAGYGSNSRFYEKSNNILGMTARQLRSGASGLEIYFATGECSLGYILVAGSVKGICAISLGNDTESLLQELKNRFKQANLIEVNKELEQILVRVINFIERPEASLDLPLDIQGTAFQQRVWQVLRQIPPGKTTTYLELARNLKEPKAIRAVAGACAKNQLALAIPCHRVVRSDGQLAGYRWGVERKKALLEREAASVEEP